MPTDRRLRRALLSDAAREWPNGTRSNSATRSNNNNLGGGCSELMRSYGLCKELRAPATRQTKHPFVFLHFSKCAGTSLLSSLKAGGWGYFSLYSGSSSRCGGGISNKCCWWRERVHNLTASGRQIRVLTQEPANEAPTVNNDGKLPIDPGFDATADFCADFAYLTVLRPPVDRTHSHMCERQVGFGNWQQPKNTFFAVRKELRDNYYVRSLGGVDAWRAPEGELRARHLRAAARTLASFDVVMTLATLGRDAGAQMHRVGLPGFKPQHAYARSRADNNMHSGLRPACDVPPTSSELNRLVSATWWDAILYEFASVLAARRSGLSGAAR